MTHSPTLELTGTVTFVDPIKHHIGIRHDAIPGQLSAGDHFFAVTAEVAVPVPGAPVGQKVDFVIESRNGQWVITKIMASQDRGRIDGEDAAVHEVSASLKSQDKAAREQGITTVIQNARKWKLANCTLVARELASVGDSRYLASRALCEIMAAVSMRSAEERAAEFRRFPYRSQWQTGMRPDARETMRTALDSLRVVNPKLHENIWITDDLLGAASRGKRQPDFTTLGDDGKAIAPVLQARIMSFAISSYWRRAIDHNPIAIDKVENSLKGLMIVAPDEPNTLNAILELLRYYLSWCKEAYAGSPRPLIYFIEQLGTLGSKAKEGLPVLRELTLVKNEHVRKAAQQSLQKVEGN